MKVRISYTVIVDDKFRRGIKRYYGEEGLASREEVVEWFKYMGLMGDHDIIELYPENGRQGRFVDSEDKDDTQEHADGQHGTREPLRSDRSEV